MTNDADAGEVGALQIRLAEDIAVHQLAAFLTVADSVYFDALWVRRAEEAAEETFPDNYSPSENEELWINRLEIGTPNLLEVIGDPIALQELAKFLATFVATVLGTKGMVQWGDMKLKLAKANLTNAKADELRRKSKISQQASEHKKAGVPIDQLAAMESAISLQPLPEVQPACSKKADAAIRAELKALNRLDVLAFMQQHWLASRAVARGRHDGRSLALLRDAYDKLKKALAPMSDVEVHALIERIAARMV
jgi:hypothetical protein